ncbi:MAG: hypothetical protein JXP39_04385 [Spirochaetales bacterium]|nr:hypothetical protein [Spirochaetales bacterium]
MKKLFLVLCAATMTSGLFAQASVNGSVRSMGKYTENEGVSFSNRLRLEPSFQDETTVFFARIEGTVDNDTPAGDIAVEYLYGSVTLANGLFKVTAGRLNMEDYHLVGGVSEWYFGNTSNDDYVLDGADGFLLQAYPVEGLDLGLFWTANGDKVEASQFGLNLLYATSEALAFTAESTLGDSFEATRFSASLSYSGIEGLAASAGYKHGAANTHGAFAILNYSAGKFAVEVAPEFIAEPSTVYVEGFLSYQATDSVSVSLIGGYETKELYLEGSEWTAGIEALWQASDRASIIATALYDEAAGFSLPLALKIKY